MPFRVAGFVASTSSGGGSRGGALVAVITVEEGTSFSKGRFDSSHPRSIGRRRSHSLGSRL